MERKHVNEFREIVYRLRRGEGVREIKRSLGLSRNTVRKYRDRAEQAGYLDPRSPLPEASELAALLGPPPLPRHMRSTVDPYAEVVKEWVEAGVEATTMWQRLRQDHGYSGSYSAVRRYLARVHPQEAEAFVRIETAPGEEAQVDFGYAGPQWDGREGRRRKAWMFVMTLSWSRHQYVEFVFDQKVATWVECHEHAFTWLGGVVQRVVIDNLKAGVLQADLYDPVLGEPYRRLAQHYGFLIRPNRPQTPRHKGKVESGVHYVKRSFLAGQVFADLEAMNRRVKKWVMEEAGLRIHGTTKQAPLARFQHVEVDALQPLPKESLDLVATYRAKIHRDCHVVVEGCYYSAPHRLIGKQVDVYVGRKIVEIYEGTELVTTHPVAQRPGERQTRNEHYPEGKRAWVENPPARCRERAHQIGTACAQVVEELLSDRVQDRLASVHSLLRLADCYGRERLERACARALHYNNAYYRTVKTILKEGLEDYPLEISLAPSPTTNSYCFARSGSEFFATEVGS
jgi:transposase